MAARLSIRDGAVSAAVFAIVLTALVSVDPRVRDHVTELTTARIAPWSDRVADLGLALWGAIRHQSIDNAPMLVFVSVGAALTLFMLRS